MLEEIANCDSIQAVARTTIRSVLGLLLSVALLPATVPVRAADQPPPTLKCCAKMSAPVQDAICYSCMSDPNHPPKCCAAAPATVILFFAASNSFQNFLIATDAIVGQDSAGSSRHDRPPVPPPRFLRS